MYKKMISVCIATYNGEQYIKSQLESIIHQIAPTDEIIISDDGSTDGTIDIIRNLNIKNLTIVHNESGKGYTSNFENALRHAQGDLIFLSDQDDIWYPEKVSKCVSILKDHTFVVSDAKIVNDNMEILYESYFAQRRPYKGFWKNIFKFGYLGCCMAFRRDIVNKAIPFPANHKMCTHDNWLFLVGAAFFDTYVLEEPLIYYRRHFQNSSDGGLTNQTTSFFKIKYRLYLLWNILIRKI